MKTSEIISVISIVASPLFGFLGVLATVAFSRGREREKQKRNENEDARDERKLDILEQQETRKQFSEMIETQATIINTMQGQIKTLQAQTKEQGEQIEQFRNQLSADRIMYLKHIDVLEKLVPNPPGPPMRPWVS